MSDDQRGRFGSLIVGTSTQNHTRTTRAVLLWDGARVWLMAQLSSVSTEALLGFRPYRVTYGGMPQTRRFEESTATGGSSKVIRAGQVVSFDTVAASCSYRIVVAPSSAGDGGNLLQTTNVVGVALETSTSDGSTTGMGSVARTLLVALADRHTEFLGYLRGDLPSHSSIVGRQRAVAWDATRNMFNIDSTNSTAALAAVVITGLPAESTVGDTNGAVLFRFLSTQTHPLCY